MAIFARLGVLVLPLVLPWGAVAAAAEPSGQMLPVGVARVDITPDYPVWLSGYASRNRPSEGEAQQIWAKALALGGDAGEGPAVLLTVDNCGVPAKLADEVCRRLQSEGVRRERLVVCSSHSHTAPWLIGFAPFLAQQPLPPEAQQARERYTRQLVEWMVQAVRQALAARRPARLSWTEGQVGFAANRRAMRDGLWRGFGVEPGGPVDHRLPVLVARDSQGRPLAIWANYACHCTTLGGDFNQMCGDWSGYAQEYLEAEFPTATALISIGCGADANPEPRGQLEFAQQHGRTLADEVKRLLAGETRPLPAAVTCRARRIELPFDKLPSREDWERMAGGSGSQAAYGRHFLERLERGEQIPQTLTYPVAVWTFGDSLAMVFLGGEVVVDYALHLYRRSDAERLWVIAYANDVPCYIASKRILREGGYEADSSMIYYGRPTRLAAEAEDLILQTVAELLPDAPAASGGE